MNTYGLSLAADVAKISMLAREQKAEEEFTRFFEIAQGEIMHAANLAHTYVDFYIPANEFDIINIVTSTIIKNVFNQQGYNVTINDPCLHEGDYCNLIEISW